MKKLVLVLAVAFSASLFSCNNAAKEEAAATDTTAVEAVEAVDSPAAPVEAVDSPKAEAPAAETPEAPAEEKAEEPAK